MDDKDREEIRQIIREELTKVLKSNALNYNVCIHEWVFTSGGAFCTKCGMTNGVISPYSQPYGH
jgi:hypothetical protein